MKHITTLLIAFLLFARLQAQDQDAITKDANKYFNLLETKNVSASLDYLYPKLYSIVDSEKVEATLKETFNDPTIDVSFSNLIVSKVSNTTQHEGVKYALVSYSYTMTMKPLDGMDKSMEKQLLQTYKTMFGNNNVVFDKKNKAFVISSITSMYAIKAVDYNSWKFLENKKGMEQLLDNLMPADVVKALNN